MAPALAPDGHGADCDRDDRGRGKEPCHEIEMQLLRLVHPHGLSAEANMSDPPRGGNPAVVLIPTLINQPREFSAPPSPASLPPKALASITCAQALL